MNPDQIRGDPYHENRSFAHSAPNSPRNPYRCPASRAFRKSPSRTCSSRSSARASRISFSRLFSFLGTTTRTRTTRLPGSPPPLARGAPAPRTLNRLPSCVPAGNLSFTVPPPGRGASISAPSAASTKLTGTSTRKSSPRRSKTECSATRVNTYRSPGGPPFFPALPLPGTRIFIPSLAPAGIFTVTDLFLRKRPLPEHPAQGFSTIVPSPPHRIYPEISQTGRTVGRGGFRPSPPCPPVGYRRNTRAAPRRIPAFSP